MADVEHKNLTDPELHEPKGIASATVNQVYVADGAGSGSWTDGVNPKGATSATNKQVWLADGAGSGAFYAYPTGWAYYRDNAATQTFGTTATKLSIDGLFGTTTEAYLPREIRGSGSLWDTTADKITPIRLGDAYELRLELPINGKTGSPTEVTVQFDIGGSATPTTVIISRYFSTGKTPPFTQTIGLPLVGLSASTITNGVQIFLNTDTGSVDILNPAITIIRVHDGNL